MLKILIFLLLSFCTIIPYLVIKEGGDHTLADAGLVATGILFGWLLAIMYFVY